MLIRCRKCGAEISARAHYCPRCGFPNDAALRANGIPAHGNEPIGRKKEEDEEPPKGNTGKVAVLVIVGILVAAGIIGYYGFSFYEQERRLDRELAEQNERDSVANAIITEETARLNALRQDSIRKVREIASKFLTYRDISDAEGNWSFSRIHQACRERGFRVLSSDDFSYGGDGSWRQTTYGFNTENSANQPWMKVYVTEVGPRSSWSMEFSSNEFRDRFLAGAPQTVKRGDRRAYFDGNERREPEPAPQVEQAAAQAVESAVLDSTEMFF